MNKVIMFILLGVICFSSNLFTLAESSELTIRYGEVAQLEVLAPDGTRLFFDIGDPRNLSAPPTAKDIALASHRAHEAHYDDSFYNDFPGRKVYGVEEFSIGGIRVKGVASSHFIVDNFTEANANMFIYIVDIAGFRIVHFGDTAFREFTPEQLKLFGKVDLAVATLEEGGIEFLNLMDQVKPSVIIPIHFSQNSGQSAAQKWSGCYYPGHTFKLKKELLPKSTRILFTGQLGEAYGKIYNLPRADFLGN